MGVTALVLYAALYQALWRPWVHGDVRRFVIVAMLAGACVAIGVVYVVQAVFVVEMFRFLDRERLRREIESEQPAAGDTGSAAPRP